MAIVWNQPLQFLIDHADKEYTPDKWCELLQVKIIDPDGWHGCTKQGITYGSPILLSEFIRRLKRCTIQAMAPVFDVKEAIKSAQTE